MREFFFLTTLVATLAAAASTVMAHGCEGQGACAQHTYTVTPQQEQQQDQRAAAVNHATHNSTHNSSDRYLNVRPVHVAPGHVVTPFAHVNRLYGQECGPRMIIVRRSVNGLNNRPMSAEEFEAGTDEYVMPDRDEPYRKVHLTPDIWQLIGHRVTETSAVVTISTTGGLGIGAFGSSAGGSVGVQHGGGMQRVVTTLRLHECVAFEVDTTPRKRTDVRG